MPRKISKQAQGRTDNKWLVQIQRLSSEALPSAISWEGARLSGLQKWVFIAPPGSPPARRRSIITTHDTLSIGLFGDRQINVWCYQALEGNNYSKVKGDRERGHLQCFLSDLNMWEHSWDIFYFTRQILKTACDLAAHADPEKTAQLNSGWAVIYSKRTERALPLRMENVQNYRDQVGSTENLYQKSKLGIILP